MKIVDRSGLVYGRLKVLRLHDKRTKQGRTQWICECSCGNIIIVHGSNLGSGATNSCGCLQKEIMSMMKTTHGESKSTEYRTWIEMRLRCGVAGHIGFKNYGGRGIKVCERWNQSFESFLHDMGKKPTATHEIERLNNNDNYTPENCIWVVRKVNTQNRRNSKWWYIDGFRYTSASEAADYFKVNTTTIMNWCGGYVSRGVVYPPKPNCWSELKYPIGGTT